MARSNKEDGAVRPRIRHSSSTSAYFIVIPVSYGWKHIRGGAWRVHPNYLVATAPPIWVRFGPAPPFGYTGLVRLRPPDPQYLKLLAPYGELIRELALAARKLILEQAPEANEFVYQVYTIADHFTFTDRPRDAFVFTTTHAKWVNLGFNFGSVLPDPDGLLRGEGKLIRHVRIARPADLEVPGVRELVRAATDLAERPEGKSEKPGTVVRAARSPRKDSNRNQA